MVAVIKAFLDKNSAFIEGIGRCIDLGGTMSDRDMRFDLDIPGHIRDRWAFESDWDAVCGDINIAFEQMKREVEVFKNNK